MASRLQKTIPINSNVQHEIQYTVTRLWPSSELKNKQNILDKKVYTSMNI